jgi:putative oxidoreductase
MQPGRVLSIRPFDRDLGLLVLRLGIGLSMLLFHGWGKISAGPERWERLGAQMGNLGIHVAPTLWGFLAACAESFGSLFLILGLFTRPAAALLALTMFVATTRHLSLPEGEPGAGWKGASHAIEFLTVYLTLILTGPGRHALDRFWRGSDERPRHHP